MKKIVITLTLLLIFLVMSIVSIQFVKLTIAIQIDNSSTIQIEKPNSSEIYGNTVPLKFNISDILDLHDYATPKFWIFYLGYSLDNKIAITIWNVPNPFNSPTPIKFQEIPSDATMLFLHNISDGLHEIRIIATGEYYTMVIPDGFNISSAPIHFTVDTFSPNITIFSPQNKIYDITDVSLKFSVNEGVSQLSYVLDNQANVTINENTTLSNLSFGNHNVTIFATDLAGNVGSSETLTFTVDKPKPESFPTLPVAVSISVIVVVVSLLIYFKKHNKPK